MAVEPYAKSSQPGRFINNISQIFDWFGGLIIQEEIQGEVRFAHPTILQTVSDKTQLRTQSWAHIDMDKASKRFGITCTTYLSFDDFKKRQLVKQSGLQDIDMTRPIWQASIGSAMPRLAKLINKMHTTSPSSSGVSRGIAQTLNEAIEPEFSTTHKIQRDHPFLQYATEFWEFHSRDFEPIDRIWPLWTALSSSADSLILHSWPVLDGTRQSQLAFKEYIIREKHFALLVWCQSGANPLPKNQMKNILEEAFFVGADAFVNKFLQYLFDLALDVSLLGVLLRDIVTSGDAQAASHILGLRSSKIGVLSEWDEIRAEIGPFQAKAYPTLLATAATTGEVRYVEELIASQEKINKRSDDGPAGCKPLEVAARIGHMKIVESLMAIPAGTDPEVAFDALKVMISSGHASDVAKLLAKRSTARAVDGGLPALLQAAAAAGTANMVAMLISAGVNVNDVFTRTSLQVAVLGGHAEVVDQLFSAGATADAIEGGLDELIRDAAYSGSARIIVKLVAEGAFVDRIVNVERYFGKTALEIAVGGNHPRAVKELLIAGATIKNRERHWGHGSLLYQAALRGNVDVIRMLLEAGMHAGHVDDSENAAKLAVRERHEEAGRILSCVVEANGRAENCEKCINERHTGKIIPYDFA
jgi:ankyrin repeat protein